ncbi:MAG: hypothetical protein VX498_13470 [Myxococcota bacterium]|nr:hypothetical protein [Myxococcota bacterium]
MRLVPRILALSLPSLLLFSACGNPDVPNIPVEPRGSVALSQALGLVDAEVTGVTIDPETGQRYVLDSNAGIFEILEDGTATVVRALADFPIPDVAPQSAFTDFVALGGERFAVTARSDGYLLDLQADTMTEYFCYEPGFMEPQLEQLTESLAFDPEAGLLYAQPATYDVSGESGPVDQALSATIGAYTTAGGQPTAWFEVPDIDFLARGAAIDLDGSLLLGRGNELHRFSQSDGGSLELVGVLPEVGTIEGLTIDPTTGFLLVVDGDSDLLIELELTD